MRYFAIPVLSIVFASPVHSQEMQVINVPEIGAESTVPAGGKIYSFARVYSINGAQLEADAKAGSWLMTRLYPKGTKLVPVDTKTKFKACLPYEGSFDPAGPCFLDDDGDGAFDRQAGDQTEMALKLKAPAPYKFIKISIVKSDSFESAILYQGATSDSLRFSYREFKNDMARSAFTEELTIPREKFPAMIMVKNIQVEVLGLTGMGLRYRIIKVN